MVVMGNWTSLLTFASSQPFVVDFLSKTCSFFASSNDFTASW